LNGNFKQTKNLKQMRGRNTTLLIVLAIVAIFVFWGCGQYNGMVREDENVKNAWGNVQSAYQRRADLIPNLVATVQGEAEFERGTSMNVSPENLTPENLEKFQQAQGQLSGALSRLLVTVEQYPNLRANDAFRDLQRQLEGTENRINTERNRFNDVVNVYNRKVRSFPNNIFAGMFGFPVRPPFEADPGAENAPKVDFRQNRPSVNFDTTKTR
jgi:LemA protein